MSDNNQWMPLYVGDYLADTMHLSGPEHGAYLLLLMHSWRTGPLPADDRKLAAIARTTPKAWADMRETIMAFFDAAGAGFVQARLERVRSEQAAKVEQRRAAGRASAEARKAQRETNERSTSVEAPLAPRAREPEPDIPSETTSLRGAASGSRRGSRLPDDWQPTAEDAEAAHNAGVDLATTAAKFRDYWHAKPGKDGVKLDWSATWRNWCRREAERRGPYGKPRESQAAVIAELMGLAPAPMPPAAFDFDGEFTAQ